jgi:hypothetical protein
MTSHMTSASPVSGALSVRGERPSLLRRLYDAVAEGRRRKAERVILQCLRNKPHLDEFQLELVRRMLGQ